MSLGWSSLHGQQLSPEDLVSATSASAFARTDPSIMFVVTVVESPQQELTKCQGQPLGHWDSKREVLRYHSQGATAAPEMQRWGNAKLGEPVCTQRWAVVEEERWAGTGGTAQDKSHELCRLMTSLHVLAPAAFASYKDNLLSGGQLRISKLIHPLHAHPGM